MLRPHYLNMTIEDLSIIAILLILRYCSRSISQYVILRYKHPPDENTHLLKYAGDITYTSSAQTQKLSLLLYPHSPLGRQSDTRGEKSRAGATATHAHRSTRVPETEFVTGSWFSSLFLYTM